METETGRMSSERTDLDLDEREKERDTLTFKPQKDHRMQESMLLT